MEFLIGVPEIKINNEFTIKSVQSFDEDEDRLYLKCAEVVPQFQKGFVCDMECNFIRYNNKSEMVGNFTTNIKDLVLVIIRKKANIFEVSEFEYVFFKS